MKQKQQKTQSYSDIEDDLYISYLIAQKKLLPDIKQLF